MNTPAHILINAAILKSWGDRQIFWYIVIGSIMPDVWMFIAYITDLMSGYSNEQIWNDRYFTSHFWNIPTDIINSIPLIALGILVTYIWRFRAFFWVFAGMLLHVAADFFLHNHDAHPHFWPLSKWKFESPVSYWDPNHYGHIAGVLEVWFAVTAGVFLLQSKLQKSQMFFTRILIVLEWMWLMWALYVILN